MKAEAFKQACHSFAEAAAPYFPIGDEAHYREALALVESLMEEVADTPAAAINAIIEMLARSIESYENRHADLVGFETRAMGQPADLAMLRVLMAQHQLGTADLPEIGSKSMVSRVLNGERSLNKNHIKALAARFGVNPGLFF